MWKSAHVRLAKYLASQDELVSLNKHYIAFIVGSILPDCMPSFITRRHRLEDTLFILKKELQKVSECSEVTFRFCLHLGIVLHYIADYFTYPHNKIFHGNFLEHCLWEKNQLKYLTSYLQKPTVKSNTNGLCMYLQRKHEQYLKESVSLEHDCKYIAEVSYHFAIRFVQAINVDIAYNFVEGQK